MRGIPLTVAIFLVALSVAGCIGAKPHYDPDIAPEDFVAGIDNPFLPFVPGAYWIYEAQTEDGTERIEVRVQDETRDILGVQATVVRDTVSIDGAVVEDTYDWFGQDADGNVWYLGEDTCEYEDGECTDQHGAWEWGVDGALPGVIMWADPQPGEPYFQEFYWKEALDEAQVIDTGRTVTVPAGTFSDTVTTKEWTRLERGVEEEATYARGIGPVLKEATKGDEKGSAERLIEYSVPAF